MNDTVIKVENLSKSYLIGHQSQEKYLALRDIIAGKAKTLGKRLIHPFKSSTGGLITVDETEEFWALKDINFEVKRGDRVGIIGRNGAGKSTLLKILSRITEPTSGRIEIDGRVASLLEVGTGFHPELTGRENIFLNGAILGMPRVEIKRKFDEIVDFAEVEKFLDTPVKRYSSGMYVRLAFAVAAHLEPEILIVDEVLAVGDAEFQKKCLGKMEEVGREGRTVLFVSHNMAAVQKMCGHCVQLDNGVIAVEGSTEKCINSYLYGSCSFSTRPAKKVFHYGSENAQVVQLVQVCLKSSSGYEKAEFDIDESIQVEIICEVFGNISNFHLYAKIHTSDGTLAFASADWDSLEGHNDKLSLGQYKASFVIPKHLLNSGCYSLSIDGLIPNTKYLFQESNILSWEVLDKGGAGGVQSVTRKGVFRPLLKWCVCSDV